jgi:uncharacterized protein YukE
MDANLLRQGLSEYITALDRQLAEMREQGERLAATWAHTREVYQGQGAEEFGIAYEGSAAMLANYVHALETMLPILRERLAALERFDSPQDPGL